MKFLGTSRLKIDEKGRLSLPSRWAEGFAASGALMLTAGPRGCLLLLERDSWLAQAARINDDLFCSPQERRLRFLFVGHAESVSTDKSDRMVIPETLRRYAEIEHTDGVFLVGTGNAIEIWATAKWKTETDSAKDADQLFDLRNDPGPSQDQDQELEPVT